MNKKFSYFGYLNVFIFSFLIYVIYTIVNANALLSDDLSLVYKSKNISQSYFSYISSYIDSTTMSARPLSGIVTGTLIYFSKYNENIYFLGLIFFPISVFTIYFVVKKIISSEFASLIVLFYSISIIGTSVQFSPIMLNTNLATIFYLLSLYFIISKRNLVLSSFLFLASTLCYEVFLPAIFLNIYLIKLNKQKLWYVIGSVILILLYRKILQPYFFVNSYQRDSVLNFLNFENNIRVVVLAVKMIFRDNVIAVFNAFKNIRRLSFFEWTFIFSICLLVGLAVRNFDFKPYSKKIYKISILSFSIFLLSFSIFIFSAYIPTFFGFDNRNLGAIRMFYTLFVISFFLYLLIKANLSTKVIGFSISIFTFIFLITNLGAKNAWIYASNFNNDLFRKIKIELQKNNINEGVVCVDFNVHNELKNNPNFITRESVFYNNWESPLLSIKNGIDPEKIIVRNTERSEDCEYLFIYKNKKFELQK